MIRDLMFASVLLLAAVPACAQDFDVQALYDQWKAEESRTLEGWRALGDPALLEKLGPLGAVWDDNGRINDGDARANVLLAVAYRHGSGGAPKDRLNSRRYLAAIRNSNLAEKAYIKRLDQFVFRSDSTTIPFLRGRIREDNRRALVRMFNAGFAAPGYLLGLHFRVFEEDLGRALSWFAKAADAGCLPAMVMTARMLAGKLEIKRDSRRALGLLDKAAAEDYIPALRELARLYHPHTGQFPDVAKCREHLTHAARLGYAPAAAMLAELPEIALDDQTVESLYAGFVRHWGPLTKTEGWSEPLLGSAPNPFLKKYPGLADYLRPFANPRNPNDVPVERTIKACAMLGACVMFGIGGAEEDHETALHWFIQVLKEPDAAPAELLYAELKAQVGGENADVLAGLYFHRAVEAGFAPAIRMRTQCSLDPTWDNARLMKMPMGEEFAWKEDVAVEKLEEIAETGDVPAMILLARRSLDDDAEVYLHWVKRAAGHEHPDAMLALAHLYKEGNGGDHDTEAATRLYRKCLLYPGTHEQAWAALTPHANPQWAIKRSKAVLAKIREHMEKHGSLDGQLEPYPFIAGAAYHAAGASDPAGAGDSAGEVLYAICKLEAHGVTRGEREAQRLLLANNDDELASYLLATMMEAGRGGYDVDVRGAVWIYKAADDVGATFAANRLGEIYRDGRHGKPDAEKAFNYFKKGAEGGCLPSMIALAKALRNGDGVEPDNDKAMQWISKAADGGSGDAAALKDKWEDG